MEASAAEWIAKWIRTPQVRGSQFGGALYTELLTENQHDCVKR